MKCMDCKHIFKRKKKFYRPPSSRPEEEYGIFGGSGSEWFGCPECESGRIEYRIKLKETPHEE